MHTLSVEQLEAQVVLELPDRELLGALITLTGKVQLTAVEHLLNLYFHDWSTLVSADGNTVTINVRDDAVTDALLRVSCTEATSDLSVQCAAKLA